MAKSKKEEEKTELYWNLTNQTMAGRKFGESVTDFFEDPKRKQQYLDSGAISYTKPETFEAAENGELVGLRKAVKSKDVMISELQSRLDKTPKSVKAAKEEIAQLKAKLKDAPKGDGDSSGELADAKNKITELETAATKSTTDFNAQFDELAEAKKKITDLEEKITDPGGK